MIFNHEHSAKGAQGRKQRHTQWRRWVKKICHPSQLP